MRPACVVSARSQGTCCLHARLLTRLHLPLSPGCLRVWLQQDTTGLGVILLTILTEEQWVEEDDVARRLNLPPKMVRKALRYLEQVRGPTCPLWQLLWHGG